ncbi:unnamed protein product, partial [marine sediment metagenome]
LLAFINLDGRGTFCKTLGWFVMNSKREIVPKITW